MGEPLESRIRTIVSEQHGVTAEEVTSDANIIDDLGADSLDVVELMMALEEAFDIEVPDEAVEGIRTIGDVQRYISEHAT